MIVCELVMEEHSIATPFLRPPGGRARQIPADDNQGFGEVLRIADTRPEIECSQPERVAGAERLLLGRGNRRAGSHRWTWFTLGLWVLFSRRHDSHPAS